MNFQENIKRCVCIIYDPQRSGQGVLALKALKLTDPFMDLYRNQNFTSEKYVLEDCNCRAFGSVLIVLMPVSLNA
jgi:hypothetical protein